MVNDRGEDTDRRWVMVVIPGQIRITERVNQVTYGDVSGHPTLVKEKHRFAYYQLGSESILETLSPALLTHTLQPCHWAFGAPHSGASPSKASPVWITLSLLILFSTVNMSPPQGGIL